jgi:hypothetical protein
VNDRCTAIWIDDGWNELSVVADGLMGDVKDAISLEADKGHVILLKIMPDQHPGDSA